MNTADKKKMVDILNEFSDQLFDRYYITNPPTIRTTNRVDRGYGKNKTKETESINFAFHTTKPTEAEIRGFIKVFVEQLA